MFVYTIYKWMALWLKLHNHTHIHIQRDTPSYLLSFMHMYVWMLKCWNVFFVSLTALSSSSNAVVAIAAEGRSLLINAEQGGGIKDSHSLGWWLSPPIVVAMVASDHSNDWLMEKQSIAGKWGARGRWQKEIRCEKIKEKSFIYLHIHIHSHAFVISIHFYFHFFRRKYS